MRRAVVVLFAAALTVGCALPSDVAAPSPSTTVTPTVATSPSPTAGNVVTGTDVVRSNAARAARDPEAARRAAAAAEALAMDLYAEAARREPGNVVLSPYSVAVALAMTRLGAAGTTAREMDAVLRSPADLHSGMNALEQALASRAAAQPPDVLQLATANQLFGQRGFPFHATYVDALAVHYGAGVRLVDYVNDTEQARREINVWVAERTRDRIPELLSKDVLSRLTRLVLTNAIYLKARWVRPFIDGATAPAPFHRLDGSTTTAQLMSGSSVVGYASGPGYEAVRLGYLGGLSMIALAPERGGFSAFEASLRDPARLRGIVAALEPTHVILRFPRFEFRTATKLRQTLSALGMPTAFSDDAEFSAMTPEWRDIQLHEVVHEAFISVDERGTEAAAATAVIGGATGGPPRVVSLTVDRPFVFVIRDDETGALLFMGRVLDPTAR